MHEPLDNRKFDYVAQREGLGVVTDELKRAQISMIAASLREKAAFSQPPEGEELDRWFLGSTLHWKRLHPLSI